MGFDRRRRSEMTDKRQGQIKDSSWFRPRVYDIFRFFSCLSLIKPGQFPGVCQVTKLFEDKFLSSIVRICIHSLAAQFCSVSVSKSHICPLTSSVRSFDHSLFQIHESVPVYCVYNYPFGECVSLYMSLSMRHSPPLIVLMVPLVCVCVSVEFISLARLEKNLCLLFHPAESRINCTHVLFVAVRSLLWPPPSSFAKSLLQIRLATDDESPCPVGPAFSIHAPAQKEPTNGTTPERS